MMKFNFLDSDWFRGVVFALLIIGILAALMAALQFVDASLKIQNNASYQAKNRETPLELQSQSEAQMLIAADVELRRLGEQRSNALIIGGIGLVALALGWIGNDFLRSRRRKLNASLQSKPG
jgi:hypothetical protein